MNREQEVTEPETLTIDVNGFSTRVWRAGSGPKLGFLAGFGGLPRWVPFLDELAKSRTVIVPSLPGFPGGERGHSVLDTQLDWVVAVHQILAKSDLLGDGNSRHKRSRMPPLTRCSGRCGARGRHFITKPTKPASLLRLSCDAGSPSLRAGDYTDRRPAMAW